MAKATESLWRNRAFTRLWFAQVVSNAGAHITSVALPLTAVLTLGATPAQMGLLVIADRLPKLIFSLSAGVWVDRARRQPILVGADLGRAVLLGSIPLAALLGALSFVHLWVVAFAVGALTIFFATASISILPALVKRRQLVEANSKFAVSDSILTIIGPGAAGALVQLVSAPKAIIVDALSYLLSALALRGVGASEPTPDRAQRRNIWAEITEGAHELVRTPVLRALALSIGVGTFGLAMQSTVLVLFFTHQLGLTPAVIGFVYTCGGTGSLIGAAYAGRASRFIGHGRAIALGNLLWAIGVLMTPLAGLFGRATAARQFFMFGLQILGAVVGGFLGSAVGLRPTLVIGVLGLTTGFLLVFYSPVRHIRDLSEIAIDP